MSSLRRTAQRAAIDRKARILLQKYPHRSRRLRARKKQEKDNDAD